MLAAKQDGGALKGAWIDSVCDQLGEQITVVNSEVEGKAMKAFTNWNIEVIRRGHAVDLSMEKKLLRKHEMLEDKLKEYIGI